MCGAWGRPLQGCGKCGAAVYCGRDCQLAHWALVHKEQCKGLAAARVQRQQQEQGGV